MSIVISTLFGDVEIGNTRICTKCNTEKPEYNFSLRSPGSNERRNQCNDCQKLQRKYLNNLKRNCGKLDQRDAVCEICSCTFDDLKNSQIPTYKNTPFVYDHDHSTGALRGVLCQNCNVAVSRLFDNVEYAKRLVEYLSKGRKRKNK